MNPSRQHWEDYSPEGFTSLADAMRGERVGEGSPPYVQRVAALLKEMGINAHVLELPFGMGGGRLDLSNSGFDEYGLKVLAEFLAKNEEPKKPMLIEQLATAALEASAEMLAYAASKEGTWREFSKTNAFLSLVDWCGFSKADAFLSLVDWASLNEPSMPRVASLLSVHGADPHEAGRLIRRVTRAERHQPVSARETARYLALFVPAASAAISDVAKEAERVLTEIWNV